LKKIEINTAQNVSVLYQVAGTGERFLALIIDVVTMLVYTWIINLIFYKAPLASDLLIYIGIGMYSPILETLNNGRTLGKMATNLKVVKINGEQAKAFDYITRWSVKGTEVYITLGSLAGLVSYFSPKGQRLGDILANTVVIKQEKVGRLNLSRISDLSKYDQYEAVYPQVVSLQEDDVILLHESLNRFRKHKNSAHTEALASLVKLMRKKLGVEPVKNNETFIKQLIKDYVILTR